MLQRVPTLGRALQHADRMKPVRRTDLEPGDWLLVTTAHSVYSIRVLEEGLFSVSGGWFDMNGLSPFRTTIAGCTWGGSMIKIDIVAACGLHLEFGNRVVTSSIRRVHIVRFRGIRN